MGLTIGLVGGVIFGLVSRLGFGPASRLIGVLIGVLVSESGLQGYMAYILCFWLWRARCTPAPWRFIAFLDDTVEQLLLRKVGGVYTFRHRLLQDYFASLDTPSSEVAPEASASLQKPDEKE